MKHQESKREPDMIIITLLYWLFFLSSGELPRGDLLGYEIHTNSNVLLFSFSLLLTFWFLFFFLRKGRERQEEMFWCGGAHARSTLHKFTSWESAKISFFSLCYSDAHTFFNDKNRYSPPFLDDETQKKQKKKIVFGNVCNVVNTTRFTHTYTSQTRYLTTIASI